MDYFLDLGLHVPVGKQDFIMIVSRMNEEMMGHSELPITNPLYHLTVNTKHLRLSLVLLLESVVGKVKSVV